MTALASFLSAAAKNDFEANRDVLDGISDKVFYLGEFGAGTKMKFIANSLVSIHILAQRKRSPWA